MTTVPELDISPDEKRRAMEAVLRSRAFSRSDQLKRFLQYICEKDIAGKAEELNEYSIAVEALGRPAAYSPADDSSVRTRAHALRQKLQEYYETEEPDAALRIDVPKGAYTPHFSIFLPTASPTVLLVPETSTPSPVPSPSNFWKPFLAGCLTASLFAGLLLAAIVLRRNSLPPTALIDPDVRAAWGPMLNPGVPVEVCIGTPPAMLLHSYKDGQLPSMPVTLLPAPKDVSSWYDALQMLDGGGRLYMHTTQDVFLFGDSLAASSAVQLLSRSGAVPHVVPESSLQVFALRDRNVALIGSPNYSPVAARLLLNAPFSVHYDPIRREEVVSDGPPDAGARHIYRPAGDQLGRLTKAYGLVTVLPSQSRPDSKSQIVIFSGITSAGSQAALEFFQSRDGLRVLESRLRQEGYTPYPQAYQVVVRCGLDHNLALNWEYETDRVMTESPLLN